MSAFAERRVQDIEKLRQLSSTSNGRIILTAATGNPVSRIMLQLHYRTAGSHRFPADVQNVTEVVIDLPARYPFSEPSAKILTPIYHPNVYTSGLICFGQKWLPSQALDLLVQRIIQIITFDPLILNERSPANGAALSWYREARRQNPSLFPTDRPDAAAAAKKPAMSWTDVPKASPERITVTCPHCTAKLALPTGESGRVDCPRCRTGFEVRT
jgi:uncharacterized Zn-finger protein